MARQITPSPALRALPPRPLSFAPSVHVRAFVLPRPDGDVLIYNAPGIADVRDDLASVTRQYLGHSHEAMFGVLAPGVPVLVHQADHGASAGPLKIRATFTRRHHLGDDLEVIPIPGHTPGSTAYLWDSGSERYLFTSDSLYLRADEWRIAVLDSSDVGDYRRSLETIRDLDFDVLVPWAASAGGPSVTRTDRHETRRRLDPILQSLDAR